MAVDDPLLGHGRQVIVREEWLRLTEEPILEPGLPIIDPHHHLWQRAEGSYLLPELLADTGSGHDIRAWSDTAFQGQLVQALRWGVTASRPATLAPLRPGSRPPARFILWPEVRDLIGRRVNPYVTLPPLP